MGSEENKIEEEKGKAEEKVEAKVEEVDEDIKRIKEEVLYSDEDIKEERIMSINLRDNKRAPLLKRSKKAINLIREIVSKYTKQKEVWIDSRVNEIIWQRGAKKPPSKIKIRVLLTNKERAIVLPIK